jgi:pimeloyl-ACP methyl ester carboxylesterase
VSVSVDERIAAIGEVELAYETFGDPGDPALLLISGIGAQMIHWPEGLCERLAEGGAHVIRFDNRDSGRSTKVGGPRPRLSSKAERESVEPVYTLSDMAADAAGLLDALGIARAHICGVSMGGMIAQRLAVDHPQRALSLASIMSTTGDRAVGRSTEAALAALTTRPPEDRHGYVASMVALRRVIGTQPIDEAAVRLLAQRCFGRGIYTDGTARQLAAILAEPDRTPQLRRLDLPTVVVHGTDDPLITFSGGEATAAAIPGAEFVPIDGLAHDLPPWSWEPIAEAIERVMRRAEQDGR